ncbi:MAG: phospholipid carrier-dependent glycosyltransferase [Gemmatimonadetes bacterium]|nr:phospholipid carrier-dependent glycosyltransferase [Gemmatimonadota bacterium]
MTVGNGSKATALAGLIALMLVIASSPQRFMGLDRLSFIGDEETSALPARALAEGRGSVMPTGMEYRRALPLTHVNAAVASRFGVENGWSYRISSAVAGVLSVPVVYGAARAFVGPQAALVAGVAMAFSEWHILFSRMGRMYVPFLLFYVLGGWMLWSWVRRGDAWRLVLGIAAFVGATSLHALAIFALQFPVVGLVFAGAAVSPWIVLLTVVALGVPAWLYGRWTEVPYGEWSDPVSGAVFGVAEPAPWAATPEVLIGGLLGVVGLALGFRVASSLVRPSSSAGWPVRAWALAAGSAAGLALALGQWWGAALCASGLLLVRGEARLPWIRRALRPLLVLVALGVGQAAYAVWQLGVTEGIKSLVSIPFPYPAFMVPQFPVLMAVFALVCSYLVLRPASVEGEEDVGVRSAALVALLTIAGIGMASSWGATRYLFHMYPFLVMVAAWGMIGAGHWTLSRLMPRTRAPSKSWAAAVWVLLILMGLDRGHGVPITVEMAAMTHGQATEPATHVFDIRPDHEGPGRYVAERLEADDQVVAEDPLQQTWYVGRVDYWLRHPDHAPGAVFRDDQGNLRDIYVGGRWPIARDGLDQALASAPGRTWIVTSAETIEERDLTNDQRAWLDEVRRRHDPVHVGRDDVTTVYCVPPVTPEPDGAACPPELDRR